MKWAARGISIFITTTFLLLLVFNFATAQTIENSGNDIVISGLVDNGDNCVLVYDIFSNPNEEQLTASQVRPSNTGSWPTGLTFQGDTQITLDETFFPSKDVLLAFMESNCNNFNPSLTDSRDRQLTNPAYFGQRQAWVYVRTPLECAKIGTEICTGLRLRLFAAEDNQSAFTATMTASVIQGVQDTGQNIWPMFVFAGVPIAFIIALQLIVFTRRSINLKNSGEFDNKKADDLEDYFSKTGGTKESELESIRKIERNRK